MLCISGILILYELYNPAQDNNFKEEKTLDIEWDLITYLEAEGPTYQKHLRVTSFFASRNWSAHFCNPSLLCTRTGTEDMPGRTSSWLARWLGTHTDNVLIVISLYLFQKRNRNTNDRLEITFAFHFAEPSRNLRGLQCFNIHVSTFAVPFAEASRTFADCGVLWKP